MACFSGKKPGQIKESLTAISTNLAIHLRAQPTANLRLPPHETHKSNRKHCQKFESHEEYTNIMQAACSRTAMHEFQCTRGNMSHTVVSKPYLYWKVMSFSLSHCHSQHPVSVQIAHATFAELHVVPAMKYDQDILLQRPTVEVGRRIAHFNLCNGCIHFFQYCVCCDLYMQIFKCTFCVFNVTAAYFSGVIPAIVVTNP